MICLKGAQTVNGFCDAQLTAELKKFGPRFQAVTYFHLGHRSP